MSFGYRFSRAFTTARAATPLVPSPWKCAVAGRPFEIDDDPNIPRDQHSYASVQYLTKFLTSPVFGSPTSVNEVGETSLNPDVNWRRSTADWSAGAGQIHFDLKDSDRSRFRSSKGIDCWTKGQFSLLHDTTKTRTSANTNLKLVTAGTYVYLADGSSLVNSTDATTWSSAVTGLTGTIAGLASDGHTVWVAVPGGVYQTTRGASSASKTNDLVPDILGYCKGRLMAGKGPALYNITTGYLSGPPSGLALTVNGTAGSTTYGYRVSAKNSAGETLACTEVTTATGNATLSATNSITLNWSAVTNATSYVVYGRTSGAELKMATVSTTTYTDDNTASPAGALPASDTTGAAPAALFTHDNSDWVWTGFATGDTAIYASGYAGDYSAVYRMPLKTDGTGLDVPIQAGELPRGETALSILGYLGFVYIGTTVGLRLATQASSGELQIGSAIPTGPARCLTGYSRFCWFGWDDYDTTSTGLGRADVTVINSDAPAYASDVMAATQGNVLAAVVFNGNPVFAVSSVGVYAQSANLVASGSIDSGLVTFDLPDPKVAQAVDVRHTNPLVGTHALAMAPDQGTFTSLGTHTATTQETPFTANGVKAEVFELRHTLTPSATDLTSGPAISRWTLMAIPAALSGEQISVPLKISKYPRLDDESTDVRDCADDVTFLKNLRKSKQPFVFQSAGQSYRATMADYQFMPSQLTDTREAWEGTFIAQLLVQDLDLA